MLDRRRHRSPFAPVVSAEGCMETKVQTLVVARRPGEVHFTRKAALEQLRCGKDLTDPEPGVKALEDLVTKKDRISGEGAVEQRRVGRVRAQVRAPNEVLRKRSIR